MRQGKRERRRSVCSWEMQALMEAMDALVEAANKATLLLDAMGDDARLTLTPKAAQAAAELTGALLDVDRTRWELRA